MNLRPYKSADLKALHKIDLACFPPGISYSHATLNRIVAHAKSKTWVAEESGEIAGFLVASEEPQKVGHIITIDVAEPHRRAGVGTMLMDAAEKWAGQKRLRMIYLETADDNRPAQNFYAARGYHKVEEVPEYYPNGQTAWVMVKWL
jgi:[ribosomal protein S18]-alanine N-acetyltransferase